MSEIADYDYVTQGENNLPEPPPQPTVEYLLGKRPVNLRKRTVQTLKEQIKERAASIGNPDDSYDSDSHSSVGSSQSEKYKRHRRKHKKKKSTRGGVSNKEEFKALQNSPTTLKRASPGLERFPTPFPSVFSSTRYAERMPIQQKIDFDSAFDEVTNELEALANSPSSISPVGVSPGLPISSAGSSPAHNIFGGRNIHPTRKMPLSHTNSVKDTTISPATQKSSKRGGPKLLPHQKNKQETQTNHQMTSSVHANEEPKKFGKFFGTKKHKLKQSNSQPSTNSQNAIPLASKDPAQFIDVLSQAIKSSPKQPRFMRQASQTSTKSNQLESTHMDIDEIELQLSEMKLMLESATGSTTQNSKRPPSPESVNAPSETSDTESDSTEYTSSSDDDTETSGTDNDSSSEESSNEDEKKKLSGQRRPIMARNIGMGGNPRGRGSGFNRARMLSRYPRLLGRRVIYLDTVEEASEEIIYVAVSFFVFCFIIIIFYVRHIIWA